MGNAMVVYVGLMAVFIFIGPIICVGVYFARQNDVAWLAEKEERRRLRKQRAEEKHQAILSIRKSLEEIAAQHCRS